MTRTDESRLCSFSAFALVVLCVAAAISLALIGCDQDKTSSKTTTTKTVQTPEGTKKTTETTEKTVETEKKKE